MVFLEDFSDLKVSFTATDGTSSTHTIYCKKHLLKKTSERTPNGRTLFTLGWPPYVNSSCLEELFSRTGHVVEVILQVKGGLVDDEDITCEEGFKAGYVVMSCASEVNSALKLCSSDIPIPCLTCDVGVRRWCRNYSNSRPTVESLESSTTSAMKEYDLKVEEAKKERLKAAQPDEDGWITVTGKSSKRKLTEESQKHKKQKKKELVNFYSWQLRETQREEIAKLRQRFEEDKQRVANLRAARKFRPY